MAFSLPNFNLVINIWRFANYPLNPPDVITMGNLTPGRRVLTDIAENRVNFNHSMYMQLLLPALTDIRSPFLAASPDVLEVPAGSGRIYQPMFVDDVAKGFANEHRFAMIWQAFAWPVPMP